MGSFGCGAPASGPDRTAAACGEPGTWIDPRTGEILAPGPLMAAMARRPVVLLGEHHDNAEHHRWQLATLASLHARRQDMIVGFEMFPRRVQKVLDRWAAGTLDEQGFLEQSDWKKVWGYDADLYLPLFRFVRQKRLGMIALNTDRSLVRRVARLGWAAIPRDQRGGLSDPAAASDAYRRYLAEVYIDGHGLAAPSGPDRKDAPGGRETIASVLGSDGFKRFVAAQLTWDRAMAEALADAHGMRPGALVVGEGHAKFGHGVPHQLADLGIADTAILLPVTPDKACRGLPATIADAVFVVAPLPKSASRSQAVPGAELPLR
jgi:uncharacterized iron-regulated protein